MAGGASRRTIFNGMTASGFAAGGAARAGKPSRSCPYGRRLTGTTVSIAGNRPGNRCRKGMAGKGLFRTQKSRTECQTRLHCADGLLQLFCYRAFAGLQIVASDGVEHFRPVHHPCLGLERDPFALFCLWR
jgi:hypothetical protein